MDTLALSFAQDNETVIVRVCGEVDLATAPSLESALKSIIDDQGNLSVRLDLAAMTFIDSTGLTVLARALKRLRAHGGDMTLSNAQPNTLRLFEIVGFSTLFETGHDS